MKKIIFTFFTLFIFIAPAWPLGSDACQDNQPCHDGGLTDEEVISVDALKDKILRQDKFILLDARSKRSFDQSHIPGAALPLTDEYYRKEDLYAQGKITQLPDRREALAQSMRRHAKDTLIVTYCGDHCQASAVLLFDIKELGFKNVRAMTPGFQTWLEKGYPSEKQ
jgi:rhodanese-related sulfurtransferase